MTERLLLDTHIVLWLDSGDTRLPPATRTLIHACWRHGWSILLSAVSVWEIALLADTGRVVLDSPVDAWLERFLDQRVSSRFAGLSCRVSQLPPSAGAPRSAVAS
jgi:PIN domain nuclease of toxin-antitoxin system